MSDLSSKGESTKGFRKYIAMLHITETNNCLENETTFCTILSHKNKKMYKGLFLKNQFV